MGDSNPNGRPPSPVPSTSRKSDEELLLEHGITKQCYVCLSHLAKFLTDPLQRQQEAQKKEFKVHYGRHFLQEIADFAYRSKPDHNNAPVDLNHLYSMYITSQFSALDRQRFKSILQSYHGRCQEEFNRRRADLIAKKVAEVAAKKKAALKRRRIFYKGSYVIVSDEIAEDAKIALQKGRRCKVLLEQIFADGSMAQTDERSGQTDEGPPTQTGERSGQTDEGPSTQAGEWSGQIDEELSTGTTGPQSPDDSELTVTESDVPQSPSNAGDRDDDEPRDRDDPLEVTTNLIRDLIEKTSQDLESSGFYDFPDDDDEEEEGIEDEEETDYAVPEDNNTDDSDDTIESPMEVEFESGESPDFSNVLRISHRGEGFEEDSEETCHGDDDFVTQSRSSYTCDTDQSNSGLPTENGDVKNHRHHNSSSGDEASCVIKQAIRSKSIVVMPVKLCN